MTIKRSIITMDVDDSNDTIEVNFNNEGGVKAVALVKVLTGIIEKTVEDLDAAREKND